MKRKQTMAMIAYGLKIAGLEENIRNLWSSIKPVVDDEVIEKIEMRLSRLAAMSEGRERDTEGAFLAFKERLDLLDTRMRHRDEAVEAMGESLTTLYLKVDQLNSGVKEHDARLTLFLGTTGEINKELQVVQHQVKEINSRLTALINEYLKVRPTTKRKGFHDVDEFYESDITGNKTKNLLTLKKSEKSRKEYKKVMKKGASVG